MTQQGKLQRQIGSGFGSEIASGLIDVHAEHLAASRFQQLDGELPDESEPDHRNHFAQPRISLEPRYR